MAFKLYFCDYFNFNFFLNDHFNSIIYEFLIMWKFIFNFIFKGKLFKLMWKGGKNNGEEDGSLNWNNYNDIYNHALKTMKLVWSHCDYTMWMKLTTWMPWYHSKDNMDEFWKPKWVSIKRCKKNGNCLSKHLAKFLYYEQIWYKRSLVIFLYIVWPFYGLDSFPCGEKTTKQNRLSHYHSMKW